MIRTGTITGTKMTTFKTIQKQYVIREILPKRLKLVVREWTNQSGNTSRSYRARIFDSHRSKYNYFTLDAETENNAVTEALELYGTKSSALDQKLPIGRDAKKIDFHISQFLDLLQTRCKNGHITPKRVVVVKQLLKSLEKFSSAHKSPNIIDLPLLYQDKYSDWRDQTLTLLTARPLTARSRNNEVNCHKQFFNFLKERGIVSFTPKTNSFRVISKVVPFPKEKYNALMSVARKDIESNSKNGTRYNTRSQWDKMNTKSLIMLMYGTGCRVTEIRNLKWKDLYRDEKNNPRIHFSGKNKERNIVVSERVFSILEELRLYKKTKGTSFEWNDVEYPFVFSSWKMKEMSIALNSSSRRRWYKEIGLDPMKYQMGCFRHRFISQALLSGVHSMQIAFYCGTSIKMIEQTYGSLTPRNLFDQVFAGSTEQSLEAKGQSKWFEQLIEGE